VLIFSSVAIAILLHSTVLIAVFAVISLISVLELASVNKDTEKNLKWVMIQFVIIFVSIVSVARLVAEYGEISPWYIGGLFFVIFSTDFLALCTGKLLGGKIFDKRRKEFTVECSPTKTLEGFIGGFIGGLVASAVVALVLWRFVGLEFQPTLFPIIAVCVVVLTILGDLLASKVKRMLGVKDFGQKLREKPVIGGIERFIASHGGFLDRFDSAFFVFACLLPLLFLLQITSSSY